MASITERPRGDGTTAYQVKWRDPDGKQRSRTAPTMRAARKLAATIDAHGGLPHLDPDQSLDDTPTLREWSDVYLQLLTGVSDRTRDDYRRQIDRHMPDLLELPLPAVTRPVVQRWVLDTAGNVSGKTLKNLKGTLNGMLKEAVRAGHLDNNPGENIPLPRSDDHQRAEPAFLTPAEFRLIALEMDEHWRRIFVLLAATGLRLGELMALTVADIDLTSRPPVVRITKALRYTRGKGYAVGPTKTKRSRRTVAIPPSVVEDLRPLVKGPKGQSIVVGPKGQTVYSTNIYRRVWRPAVEAAQAKGLTKNPRIHDLRHTHASWLIAEGVPLPVIQSRLGHESITTTVDRYGHLLPDLHVEAAAATQRALES